MSREPDDIQQRRCALGEQLATFRQAAQLTQIQLAKRTYFDRSRIAHLERGTSRADQRFWAAADDAVGANGVLVAAYLELETAKQTLAAHERARELAVVRARADRFRATGSAESATVAPAAAPTVAEVHSGSAMFDRRTVLRGAAAAAVGLQTAEILRRELADAVNHAAMSDASLDDWEHTVYRYGLAGRYRSAASLLVDLTADFVELRRLLERRRAILVPTRLTRIVAQMAGLMSSTLNRLDHIAARNWARTAKHVASEAGDSTLQAWVLTHEAYAHYYNGNLAEAVYVAAHAQHIAKQAPCAGVADAAALEARAHALSGRVDETRAALDRVERALSRMDAQALAPSVFGYSEARFNFHAGNAYTHLGLTADAVKVQERALSLLSQNDYLDRTLVMLDRADCLVQDNEVPAAADYATQALLNVGSNKRNPMIDNRARQVLGRMSATAPKLPAVRELGEMLEPSQG